MPSINRVAFLSFVLILFSGSSALAQSTTERATKARDNEKSVITDEVYYLIPVEDEKVREEENVKDESATKSGISSAAQSAGAKSGGKVSAVDSGGTSAINNSTLMAPGGGGGGGGGGSGPDPIHETYARQNIREDLTPYGSDLLGEQFDMATGTLSFNHTDIALPGNNGLEVAVRRTVNTAQGRFVPDNAFGDWEIDVPKMEMMVSSQVSGWWQDDRCTTYSDPGDVYWFGTWYYNYEYWNGLKMHIPGQGSQAVLDNPTVPVKTGGNTKKTTTQYWDISCTNSGGSEGFIATSPSGIKYHFDSLKYRAATGVKKNNKIMGRKRAQMFATKVEDRFGNYVNYTYGANGPTSIIASDGRTITISYGTNNKISSITANGRTWTYGYTTYTGYSWDFLTSVTLPDGESWDFDLHEIILAEAYPGLLLQYGCNTRTTETGTVTHPHGAKGTYTITETAHGRTDVPKQVNLNSANCTESYHIQRSFDVLSLTQKKIEGPGLTTMTWDYTYSENQGGWAGDSTNPLKTTRVDKPDGSYDIYHHDRSWTYAEGSLIKHEVFSPTGTLLQTVENEYEAGHGRGFFGELFYENLAKNGTPKHRYKVTTTRGTDVYTTEYDFDTYINTAPNPDVPSATFSYGNPIQIDQSNSFSTYSRVEDIVYAHDTTNWELARETTRTIGTETVSENTYDSNNRVKYVDAYGVQVKEFSYNSNGTVAWLEDALGNRVTLANWKRGIPELITYPDTTTHEFDVDDNGWILESTDAKGNLTEYEYDDMGRLEEVDYPDEAGSTRDNKILELIEVTTANDGLTGSGIAIGQWKHKVSRGELEITTYLDALFRPVLTRSEDINDSLLDRFSRAEFDHNNRTTFSSFPSATVSATTGTDTEFDALGRVKETEENVTPYAKSTFSYLNGNKVTVTNPRGKSTTTTYFALGSPDQSSPTLIEQPESVTTTIVRNDFGEMTSATQSGTNPTVSLTRNYYYNTDHRLCRQVDPETGSTAYSYTNAGQMEWYALAASGSTSSCDLVSVPAGERILHSYNNMGQLTLIDYPDSTPDTSYDYDDNGNLTDLNHEWSEWDYTHDKVNALDTETLSYGVNSYPIDYDRDSMDRLEKITYPTTLAITYTPNAYGEPESVGSYASNISYHPNGSIESLTYGNGRVYTTTQNDRQLPEDLTVMDGSTAIADLTHLYDASANITSIEDHVTPTHDRSMGYDDIDRLTSAAGVWGAGSYSFDALGNILSKSEGGQAISYNYNSTDNTLTSVTGAASRNYQYDDYGNVIHTGSQVFTYDLSGSMRTSTGPWNSYNYDGHKRRTNRYESTGQVTRKTVYGSNGKLMYKNASGSDPVEYIYAGSLLIAKKQNTDTHYLHTDLLGSPINGEVGGTSYTDDYTPWGEKWSASLQLSGDVGYTGHQEDLSTGFVYMQARYYDPVVGRFMAVDPMKFSPNDPMTFNAYSYVYNNPINYIDPDGASGFFAMLRAGGRQLKPLEQVAQRNAQLKRNIANQRKKTDWQVSHKKWQAEQIAGRGEYLQQNFRPRAGEHIEPTKGTWWRLWLDLINTNSGGGRLNGVTGVETFIEPEDETEDDKDEKDSIWDYSDEEIFEMIESNLPPCTRDPTLCTEAEEL